MPKLIEILHLHYESKLSRRSIATSLSISRSTVTNILTRAETAPETGDER